MADCQSVEATPNRKRAIEGRYCARFGVGGESGAPAMGAVAPFTIRLMMAATHALPSLARLGQFRKSERA